LSKDAAKHHLTADASEERLDVFLTGAGIGLSRSQAQRLIEGGFVTVDGRRAKPSQRLEVGAGVTVTIPPPQPIDLAPEAIPLTIIYQDADILVVDKPAGMPVHPGPGHASGTLVNAVLALCPDLSGIGGALRPGIVHRLDKERSGLILVAKNDRAHQSLSRQLKERQVEKSYLAAVHGIPRPPEGVIEGAIARHPIHRKKMAIVAGGKAAETRYRTLQRLGDFALLEAQPVTGRTHQIRVHLASIGHPILGDAIYGKRSPHLARQFLHAHRIEFDLPSGGRRVQFSSPLPPDLEAALTSLREGIPSG